MPSYRKVVLDTNFLMIPGTLGVDIFDEIARVCNFSYKLYIVDKTIAELKKLEEARKTRYKTAAKIALELVKRYKISKIKSEETDDVDKTLVKLNKKGHIIATQDKDLKKKLKNNIIILKQKKHLEVKGEY